MQQGQKKTHAIENVKKHFGKWSSILAISLLSLTFLKWFTFQLSSTSSTMTKLFHFHKDWEIGLFLGSFVSFLGIGGFKMLKWACLVGLPILSSIAFYYIIFDKSPTQYKAETFPFSYFAILPVLLAYLSGTVNLPTFFRHSRSKPDSITAMSLIFIIHALFQIATIFYGTDTLLLNTSTKPVYDTLHLILASMFSITSFLCVNLTNIYFVSACWEMIFPRDYGHKKYVIVGIIGTASYLGQKPIEKTAFFPMINPMINYSMIILLISLIIHFLISIAVKHRLLYLSKFLGSMSWLIGCIVTITTLIQNPNEANKALLFGCATTLLFAVVTVFLEETFWAIKTLKEKKKN